MESLYSDNQDVESAHGEYMKLEVQITWYRVLDTGY